MDELIIVKRTKNNQFLSHHPIIKIGRDGRHTLSDRACQALELKDGDGVMFAFNNKERKGYIFKDDDAEAFIVRVKSHEKVFRFCAKELIKFFDSAFGTVDKYNLFKLGESVKKNGQLMYEMHLYNDNRNN
jgi:hypothetical protein